MASAPVSASRRQGLQAIRSVLAHNSLSATTRTELQALPPPYDDHGLPRPLRWYACGPTVYDSAHLGHAR